jgi:hypothetical protein
MILGLKKRKVTASLGYDLFAAKLVELFSKGENEMTV